MNKAKNCPYTISYLYRYIFFEIMTHHPFFKFNLINVVVSVFFVFGLTQQAYAQPYKFEIDGIVREGDKNLSGAKISVSKNGAYVSEVATGSNGRFFFALEPEAKYLIEVSKPGFVTKRISFITNTDGESGPYRDFIFNVVIFRYVNGLNTSMFKEPIAEIFFNKAETNLDFDTELSARNKEEEQEIFDDLKKLRGEGTPESEEKLAKNTEAANQQELQLEAKREKAKAAYVAANGGSGQILIDDSKAKAEADRLAKIDADKAIKARLAAEAKAKVEADRLAKLEADKNSKAEADRLAAEAKNKIEADRLAKLEADKNAKAEADRLAAEVKNKVEADRLAKLEADKNAKAETDRLAAEAKNKIEADRLAKLEADKNAKAETDRLAADAKNKIEADRLAKLDADKNAKAETDRLAVEAKNKIEADRLAKLESDKNSKAEADRLAAEAKNKIEADRLASLELTNKEKNAADLAAQQAEQKKIDDARRISQEKIDAENALKKNDESDYIIQRDKARQAAAARGEKMTAEQEELFRISYESRIRAQKATKEKADADLKAQEELLKKVQENKEKARLERLEKLKKQNTGGK